MPLNPSRPLLYLITSGTTNPQTTSSSNGYADVLRLIDSAVAADIDLIQIREKSLTTRVLFELASDGVRLTRGTRTQLLINDRADVATAVGADGVHLSTRSVPAAAVRKAFGSGLLIGVSTHSLEEAKAATTDGADFIVFGPVFDTRSKQSFGPAAGVEELGFVAAAVAPLPVIALGGIDVDNVHDCARTGAAGVAAITLFSDPTGLVDVAREVRARFRR